MSALVRLAWQSAWARRLTLGITLVAIAVSTALLLAVERVRSDARQSFAQSVAGVDLVVGPRMGALPLLLHAVFHHGAATHGLRSDSVAMIASHPAVDWAIPLSLGDGHQGFPVLGTDAGYFTHLRDAAGQPLAFAAGRPFQELFETVPGSEVAATLGYRPGDRITLSHGIDDHDDAPGHEHGDKPFTVVGILAPTGTPIDRTLHVSLEAISALHLDWAGGAPLPGLVIPAEQVKKFDLAPRTLSAVLVGLKQRSDVLRLQRHFNDYRGEPLLAVMPAVVLDELWALLAPIERLLLVLSTLVVLVGLAGLVATLLAALNERRRELAILRSLGAGPADIFVMLALEGFWVTALGLGLGIVLLVAGSAALAPVASHVGVHLSTGLPRDHEWALLAALLTTGLLVSLVPGWRAWRMSLADGLTPRN